MNKFDDSDGQSSDENKMKSTDTKPSFPSLFNRSQSIEFDLSSLDQGIIDDIKMVKNEEGSDPNEVNNEDMLNSLINTVLKAENNARNQGENEDLETTTEEPAENRENTEDILIEDTIPTTNNEITEEIKNVESNAVENSKKKNSKKTKKKRKKKTKKKTQTNKKKTRNTKKNNNDAKCSRSLKNQKEKYRKFQQRNCNRARSRGRTSYESLVQVYEQLFEINRFSDFVMKQIEEYVTFLKSVSDFLEKNAVCKTNLQWNKMMIEVNYKISSTHKNLMLNCFLLDTT